MTTCHLSATRGRSQANPRSRPRVRRCCTIVAALALTAGNAAADDTEVFFPAPPADDSSGPRVLLVLPTSRTMGCPVGSTGLCAQAVEDGSSRIDVLEAALVRVAGSLAAQGVSLGILRGNNDGGDTATDRGGFVAQEVAPLTPQRLEELQRWICPFGTDRRDCRLVRPPDDPQHPGQTMLAPSNDAGFCATGPSGQPDCRGRLGPGRQRLTELLFEASRYFAGRRPAWGTASRIGPGFPFPGADYVPTAAWGPATAVPEHCTGEAEQCRYRSPAAACHGNVVVIVSDGVLGPDDSHDEGRQSIANSAGDPAPYDRWFRPYLDPRGLTGAPGPHGCSVNSGIAFRVVDPATREPTDQRLSDCADDLAYSLRSGGFVDGQRAAQVFTHTIAFDVAAATQAEGMADGPSRDLLQLVARAGGGRHHSFDCDRCTPAQATDALARMIESLLREAVAGAGSFAAPTVPVNSFNRTENLDELYLAVFRPNLGLRWRGNVKKYRLAASGDILGRDEALAVNPLTGQFLPGVEGLWPARDGAAEDGDVLRGGAADALPPPDERRIYTNADGAGTVALVDYPIARLEGRDDAARLLGYTAAGLVPPACPDPRDRAPADPGNPAVCQLIDWLRGVDVADESPRDADDRATGNGDHREPRRELGDPLHARPVVVDYGGERSSSRSVVFAVTNEGALHAFEAGTGRERWAFVPWDRLARMVALYRDAPSRPRSSLGLDGTLRVLRLDHDGDGVIEPSGDGSGDRVVLYFGMRRGGERYYAVDVTQVDFLDPARDRPSLLWTAGPPDQPDIPADRHLPRLGQTWSRPAITRLAVPGHTGRDDYVVVFSGGYDPLTQDPADNRPLPYVDDATGTGLYVLDAFSGRRLWRAGPDAGADLVLPTMTAATPGDATVIDLSGDGYADVAYLGDLRGRVWRFDFARNAASLDRLASGGILASLGGSGVSGARRFFGSPDVSWVVHGGRSWLNVAIGSGNRELPLSDTTTEDRFYGIRDYHGRQPRDWSRHVPLTEADLVDVTPADASDGTQATVPPGAAGWLLRLDTAPGEKAISASRTLGNTVFFPTFVPESREPDPGDGTCPAPAGYNLLYQVGVVDARPARSLQDLPRPTAARGLAVRLAQPGIAPPPAFVFPAPGADTAADAGRAGPLCLVGTESCGRLEASGPRRTYWRERGAE